MKADKAKASSRADGLVVEQVQAKSYIHSTLSMEYRRQAMSLVSHSWLSVAFRLSWPKERRP